MASSRFLSIPRGGALEKGASTFLNQLPALALPLPPPHLPLMFTSLISSHRHQSFLPRLLNLSPLSTSSYCITNAPILLKHSSALQFPKGIHHESYGFYTCKHIKRMLLIQVPHHLYPSSIFRISFSMGGCHLSNSFFSISYLPGPLCLLP